jgi:hypothetical protein
VRWDTFPRESNSRDGEASEAAPNGVCMNEPLYPDAVNPDLGGDYPATAGAGGGFVWDDVLEYRVWCHPERGASDLHDGSDYYYPISSADQSRTAANRL